MAPLIYNGTTITAVVYNGTNLSSLVYNGTTVWTAGFSKLMMFGGAYYNGSSTAPNNGCRILNENMDVVAYTFSIAGATARQGSAGASMNSNGMFFGGGDSYAIVFASPATNKVTSINSATALVTSEASIGSGRSGLGGASYDGIAIYYAGLTNNGTSPFPQYNTVTRISSSQTLVGSETSVGSARHGLSGAYTSSSAIYFGGMVAGSNPGIVTRINSSGSIIGSETSVSVNRYMGIGGNIGSNALFALGSTDVNKAMNFTKRCTRVDANGSIYGSDTTITTNLTYYLAGGSVGSSVLAVNNNYTNNASIYSTKIDANGSLVSNKTTTVSATMSTTSSASVN